MYTLRRFTEDPTLDTSEEIGTGWKFNSKSLCLREALNLSVWRGYFAVYAHDGEQLAGFVNGKAVH